ncbi:MAG: N,N-dimethylformamidase beta subunit family domain-containing protein [Vulcanimicrobiaceae bacterium]
MAEAIEGYANCASVAPGETIGFCVRSDAAHQAFTLQIYRRGVSDQLVTTLSGSAFVPGAQDDVSLASSGCGWPIAAQVTVPAQWKTGYYVGRLSAQTQSAWMPFVVRTGAPKAKIVAKLSDTTSQAYNAWGARSLYSTPFVPHVSFDRPYGDDLTLYEQYQLPFIQWAETKGYAIDYCSSLDLHTDPNALAGYRLLLSIGHDEYWTLEMRDQIEALLASGGNVAFLSANTCYWQARFDQSNGGRVMVCYKETDIGPVPDPDRSDPGRVTVRWYEAPVNRPENLLTGVSYRNGAGWWNDPIVPAQRYRGYTVTNASHWVYAGSGLSNGDTFGGGTTVDDTILGYETDAALIAAGSDPPAVDGSDGTPRSFVVLATADLTDWGPGGQAGRATLGLYQRNGIAFTAGTVNWAGGLRGSAPVATITSNLLDALAGPAAPQLPISNPGFEQWDGANPAGWTLDGAGSLGGDSADADASANQMRFSGGGGNFNLKVDASAGETWAGYPGLNCAANTAYGVGCWAKSDSAGATLRLQTTDSWTDIAQASHSGSGNWEYLFAVSAPQPADFPARVKIQVAGGVVAWFDDVSVVEVQR